jgi:5-methylcytosine-specific restriction protein A
MGRLKALPPRLKPMGTRLQPAMTREESEAKRYRDRDAQVSWRKWYFTARWKKLRNDILIRDNYTCQRSGVLCIGKHPAPNSPVVNHKKPHRGDERLFWDPENLEVVAKSVHDSEIQSEERRAPSW